MRRQPDIFDLFRDNQHKLSQRPSGRAWRRLERGLNQSPRAKQTYWLRQWSLAAAVIVLVGLTAVILWSIDQRDAGPLADGKPSVAAIEQLSLNEQPSSLLRQVTFAQRNLKAVNIEEGPAERQLVVARRGGS